jgi:hypothetical protein
MSTIQPIKENVANMALNTTGPVAEFSVQRAYKASLHEFSIEGYIRDRVPFVDLVVQALDRRRRIAFKIDTAAERTVISPSDASDLGLEDLVSESDERRLLTGFSGKENSLSVPVPCTFWFPPVSSPPEDILIGVEREILVLTPEEESRESMNSILGVDIIQNFEFCLNHLKNTVVLTPNTGPNQILGYSVPVKASKNGKHNKSTNTNPAWSDA